MGVVWALAPPHRKVHVWGALQPNVAWAALAVQPSFWELRGFGLRWGSGRSCVKQAVLGVATWCSACCACASCHCFALACSFGPARSGGGWHTAWMEGACNAHTAVQMGLRTGAVSAKVMAWGPKLQDLYFVFSGFGKAVGNVWFKCWIVAKIT